MSNNEYFNKLKNRALNARRNLAIASRELGFKKRNEIFDKSYEASLNANLNPYYYVPKRSDNKWKKAIDNYK